MQLSKKKVQLKIVLFCFPFVVPYDFVSSFVVVLVGYIFVLTPVSFFLCFSLHICRLEQIDVSSTIQIYTFARYSVTLYQSHELSVANLGECR